MKKVAKGGVGLHAKAEETGSVYFSRPLLGRSPDVRQRHFMNDYGKDAAPDADQDKGLYHSPARTMRSP